MTDTKSLKKGPRPPSALKMGDESRLVAGLGAAPGDLDEYGAGLWELVASEAKWLAVSDAPALRILCICMQQHYRLSMELEGYLDETDGYDRVAMELSKQAASMSVTILRHLTSLGLTPKARSEQGLAEVKLQSKMDQFMSKRSVRDQQQKRYKRDAKVMAGGKAKAAGEGGS